MVIMPCGFSVKHTEDELQRTPLPPVWKQLAAARDNRVYIVDANRYFSRSGPRLADGVAILASFLHPEINFAGAAANTVRVIRPADRQNVG